MRPRVRPDEHPIPKWLGAASTFTLAISPILVLAGLGGCSAEPQKASWKLSFARAELSTRAVVVRAQIAKGGCDESAALYTLEFGAGENSPVMPPRLPAGFYGLSGRARDLNCLWFAGGCKTVALPLASGANVEISMDSIEEEPSCGGAPCMDGYCANDDAGTSPVDGGKSDCPLSTFAPLLLYTFQAVGSDNVVADAAPVMPNISLSPDATRNPVGVTFSGGLATFSGGRLQAADGLSKPLGDAILASGSFSVEVWFQTDVFNQTGPARIFTYSSNTGKRGFSVLQDGSSVVGRVRTTATDNNGNQFGANMPAFVTKPFTGSNLHQTVLLYDGTTGRSALYLDGSGTPSERTHMTNGAPSTLNWDTAAERIGSGDEFNLGTGETRVWKGSVKKATVYDRALSAAEIQSLYLAGSDACAKP